jgi:hypothetical protein
MQRLIMTAATAAMFCGVVMTATSAKAEYNYGSMKNGAQCYKMSTNGWNNQGFGFWSSCPNPGRRPSAQIGPRATLGNDCPASAGLSHGRAGAAAPTGHRVEHTDQDGSSGTRGWTCAGAWTEVFQIEQTPRAVTARDDLGRAAHIGCHA